MELPNPKSPCLNLAGSDVLHYFVTRLVQIPSTPCWHCYINRSNCCPIISHAQGENSSLPFISLLNCYQSPLAPAQCIAWYNRHYRFQLWVWKLVSKGQGKVMWYTVLASRLCSIHCMNCIISPLCEVIHNEIPAVKRRKNFYVRIQYKTGLWH